MDVDFTEDGADERVVPAATTMLTQTFDRMLETAAAGDAHALEFCGATAMVLSHAHLCLHPGSSLADAEKAKDVLRRGVTADPSHTESWAALADVHLLTSWGDDAAAKDVLMQGIAANPTSLDLHESLAEMCIQGGDLDDAERALRAAEELLSEAEDVDDEDRLEHEKEMQDLRAQLASAREGDDVV